MEEKMAPPLKQKLRVFSLNKYILLCFAVPFLGMVVAFIANGIFPFGKSSVMSVDLYHMYGPLITHLHDMIYGNGISAFSFDIGMGMNYFTLFATNVGSPLNAIIALFPRTWMPDLIALGMVIKVGLSGFFMGIFLRYKWKKCDMFTVAFAAMYALCGYMVNYYWNIMWSDIFYILPLCLLGIELLLDHGKFHVYTLSLFYAMICNYYIAALMCAFLALYFLVTVLSRFSIKKDFGKIAGRSGMFALFSVLAAALAGALLVPVWYSLQSTSSIADAFPQMWKEFNSWYDLLLNHLPGAAATMRSGELPHIYAGFLSFLLLPLYFSDERISAKERILHMLLGFFLLVCMNYKGLDFIWHGLHTPNDLPFRYSFFYSALLIIMAYPQIRRINRKTLPTVGIWGGIILLALFVGQLSGLSKENIAMLIAAPVLLAAFMAIFHFSFSREKLKKSAAAVICVGVVFVELSFMAGMGVGGTSNMNRKNYITPMKNYNALATKIDEIDDGLWRAETIKYMTLNDPALFGYRGITHFSSMLPMDLQDTMDKLGYHSYMNGNTRSNRFAGQPNTPLMDSLLGVKYLLRSATGSDNEFLYGDGLKEPVHFGEEGVLFQNPYAVPLIFAADEGAMDFSVKDGGNPFTVQEQLVEAITTKNYSLFSAKQPHTFQGKNLTLTATGATGYKFEDSDTTNAGKAEFFFTAKADEPLYLYADGSQVVNVTIDISGQSSDTTVFNIDGRYPRVLPVGLVSAGDEVIVTLKLGRTKSSGTVNLHMVSMDIDAFKTAITDIGEKGMWQMDHGNDYVSGKLYSDGKSVMFSSIPADAGWQIFIDGRAVEKETVLDGAFLAVRLPEGLHDVELKWTLPGLDTGIKVSLVGLVLLLLLTAVFKLAPVKSAGERTLPDVVLPDDTPTDGGTEGDLIALYVQHASGIFDDDDEDADDAEDADDTEDDIDDSAAPSQEEGRKEQKDEE